MKTTFAVLFLSLAWVLRGFAESHSRTVAGADLALPPSAKPDIIVSSTAPLKPGGNIDVTINLAEFLGSKENRATAHAAYVRLDRLTNIEPARVLEQLFESQSFRLFDQSQIHGFWDDYSWDMSARWSETPLSFLAASPSAKEWQWYHDGYLPPGRVFLVNESGGQFEDDAPASYGYQVVARVGRQFPDGTIYYPAAICAGGAGLTVRTIDHEVLKLLSANLILTSPDDLYQRTVEAHFLSADPVRGTVTLRGRVPLDAGGRRLRARAELVLTDPSGQKFTVASRDSPEFSVALVGMAMLGSFCGGVWFAKVQTRWRLERSGEDRAAFLTAPERRPPGLRAGTVEADALVPIASDNESLDQILRGWVRSTVGEAGQIFREFLDYDHGLDGEIEFRDSAGRPGGKRIYLQLKSGDSYLQVRKVDGAEIFRILKPRHADYWRQHAYPVYLVIRTSDRRIRWMNVTAYLNTHFDPAKPTKQIVFDAETFTARSLLRVCEKQGAV